MQVADGVKVPVAAVAKVETLKVGQRVYAIGSPTGLELTLSEGLISALRANAQGQLPTIQTSAAISPGSSGGGLFDAEARLIGVTVSVAKGENLGFAYPAEWLAELPQRLEAELIEWRRLLQSLGVVLSVGGDPTPSGHAAIDNDAALPVEGLNAEAMRQAYRQFLLQARPRAFMITSDGKAGAVTSAAALVEQLKACSERKAQCAVYAVDSAVVWGKQAQASK